MIIRNDKYVIELTQEEINILEGELFTLKNNYKKKTSQESRELFEKECEYLERFYHLIGKNRKSYQ